MAAQLAKIGLSFDDPDVILFPASRPDSKGAFPTIGTRGCYQSHLAVLEDALEAGCETFLVLEDDVDLMPDFGQRIAAMVDNLATQPWDMFYGWNTLTYTEKPVRLNTEIVEVAASDAIKLQHFTGMRRAVAEQALPYLRGIAERPMGDPLGGAMHVDGAYSWFRAAHPEFRTFAARYPLARQRPSRSDIRDLNWYDRLPLFQPVIDLLRHLKHAVKRLLGRS